MVNTMQLRNFDKPKTLPSCLPDDVPHTARVPVPSFVQQTRVVNIKHITLNGEYVYIGRENPRYKLRRSKWANPFKLTEDTPEKREECLAKYREYVLSRPDLMAALPELRGKGLACWCSPLPCHGDVLVELLNEQPTLDEWHKNYSDDEARFRREVVAVRRVDGKVMYELTTGELVTPEQWRGNKRPDTPEAAVFAFIVQWYLAHRDLLEIAVKEALSEPPAPKPPKATPAWERVQDLPPMVLTREWLDPCADPVQRRREAVERVKALGIEPRQIERAAPLDFDTARAWAQAREQGEKLTALYRNQYDWRTGNIQPRKEKIAA